VTGAATVAALVVFASATLFAGKGSQRSSFWPPSWSAGC